MLSLGTFLILSTSSIKLIILFNFEVFSLFLKDILDINKLTPEYLLMIENTIFYLDLLNQIIFPFFAVYLFLLYLF